MRQTDEGIYLWRTKYARITERSPAEKLIAQAECKLCGWCTPWVDYHPEAYAAVMRHMGSHSQYSRHHAA